MIGVNFYFYSQMVYRYKEVKSNFSLVFLHLQNINIATRKKIIVVYVYYFFLV